MPSHARGDIHQRAVAVPAFGMEISLYHSMTNTLAAAHEPRDNLCTLPLIRVAVAAGDVPRGFCPGFTLANCAAGKQPDVLVHETGTLIAYRQRGGDYVKICVNSIRGQNDTRRAPGLCVQTAANPDYLVAGDVCSTHDVPHGRPKT